MARGAVRVALMARTWSSEISVVPIVQEGKTIKGLPRLSEGQSWESSQAPQQPTSAARLGEGVFQLTRERAISLPG